MGEREQMIERIIHRIRKFIIDWHYELCMTGIMGDAIEHNIDADIVDKRLENNYKNHYDK